MRLQPRKPATSMASVALAAVQAHSPSAQHASSMAIAGRKRGRDDFVTPTTPTPPIAAPASSSIVQPQALPVSSLLACPKRRRRSNTIDALLKTDGLNAQRYQARTTMLMSLNATDAALSRLLEGLNGNVDALLRVFDLNVAVTPALALIHDCSARGVSLTTLNVRAHSFSMSDKETVLARFAGAFRDERWLRDIIFFVAKEFFTHEREISIVALAGGGVRDVLFADWCAAYGLRNASPAPTIVIVTDRNGRAFGVPFYPES